MKIRTFGSACLLATIVFGVVGLGGCKKEEDAGAGDTGITDSEVEDDGGESEGGDDGDTEITDYTTLVECVANGGYWYDSADVTKTDAAGFAALSPSCHEEATSECPASGNLPWVKLHSGSLTSENVTSGHLWVGYSGVAAAKADEVLSTIRCFQDATELLVSQGNLTSVNLTANPGLEYVRLPGNDLGGIDVRRQVNLRELDLTSNPLAGPVDLASNPALMSLGLGYVDAFDVRQLDLSDFPALDSIDMSGADLSAYDMTRIPATVRTLTVDDCNLSAFSAAHLVNLEYLSIGVNTDLVSLDLRGFPNLVGVNAYGNSSMTSLNVHGLTSLQYLLAYYSALTSLDVTTNTALEWLDLEDDSLTSIDLTHNPLLSTLWLKGNVGITSLNLSANTALTDLFLGGLGVTGTLNLSTHANLSTVQLADSAWSSVDLSAASGLTSLSLQGMPNLSVIDFSKLHTTFKTATTGVEVYIEPSKWTASTGEPAWGSEPYGADFDRFAPDL